MKTPDPKALEARKQQVADVPCGACRACCVQDRIFLGPTDDPKSYRWHIEDGYAVLDRKPNGECIYLGDAGCSIHERAPSICRRFDCRVLVLTTPAERMRLRIQQNPQMAQVYQAGLERMSTLAI